MYCEQCGAKISDNAKFCNECGARVVKNTPVGHSSVTVVNNKHKDQRLRRIVLIILGIILSILLFITVFRITISTLSAKSLPQNSRSNHASNTEIKDTQLECETAESTEKIKNTESVLSVDEEFIRDLEEAIKVRSIQSEDKESYLTVINSELSRLEKYRYISFDDKQLEALARKYIDGILLQKDSFQFEHSAATIIWAEGLVQRHRVLKDIYGVYTTFPEINDFQDNYIFQLKTHEEHLTALKAIHLDLTKQLLDHNWNSPNRTIMNHSYTNNTSYSFDVELFINFVDDDGSIIESVTAYIGNIEPQSTRVIECYFPGNKLGAGDFRFEMQMEIYVDKFNR